MPRDGWALEMDPLFADAERARGRSPLKMDAFVHRQFVFDAGMSLFCKVCGVRSQSLFPSDYFRHRKSCPLLGIQERVREAGGWPDRVDDELEWKHASTLRREAMLPFAETAALLLGEDD